MYGQGNTSYRKRKRSSSTVPRRRYKRRNTTSIPYAVKAVTANTKTVLPRTLETTFRFVTRLTIGYIRATGFSGIVNVAGNSLFDPLGTSGTAQPPFFDQMMTFYQRYQVIKSQVKIAISNTAEIPVIVYCVPVTDLTDTYTEATASVMPYSKRTYLGSLNGSNSIAKINNTVLTKQVVGVADASDLQGTAITNPTRIWYWHISSVPMLAGLTVDYDVTLHVEFIMTAILSDIQIVANS